MRSQSTGRVVPKTCKSWLCPHCNVWLREGAKQLLATGARRRPEGYDCALFTFTEPPTATLDLPAMYARHQRTIQRLRSRGYVTEYATAIEFQRRGALHPHILAHVPEHLVPRLRPFQQRRRDREQYRFWSGELRELAVDLGWGPVCDATAAGSFLELGSYAVKSLSAYATKQAHRRFKEAGATRVRPIRASRGWAGVRLRDLQRGNLASEGPWEDVSNNGPCH